MDAQQKLSQLFAELENESTALAKKKADLTGEVTTLTAKQQFLTGSIADLGKERENSSAKHTQAVQKRYTELKELDQVITGLKTDIGKLGERKKVAEAELQGVQVSHEKQIKILDEQIKIKQDHSELNKQIEDKHNLINTLDSQISDHKQILNKLDEDLEFETSESKKALGKLSTKIDEAEKNYQLAVGKLDDKLDELEDLGQKITEAEAIIAEAVIKRKEFNAYEQKAIKALEARESALVQGEKQLQTQVVTSKRRYGVLDKID